MCNCRSEIEKKLLDRLKQQQPEAQDHLVEIKGYALLFGDTLESKPYLPIEGSYKLTNKNGELKLKKLKDSMIASYCPFCGISLNAKPDATAA